MYSEAPRLRHQLAQLLNEYGHPVIFYQNPEYLFSRNKTSANNKVINNLLEIRQSHQIIHHQLRLFTPLKKINEYIESKDITRISSDIENNDIIINFNYDYYFLKKLFPNNKIITIINDDFVAQAKFRKGAHVKTSLKLVCENSDAVLAVSYPLLEQVKQWSNKCQLFLPWSKQSYKSVRPEEIDKNSILLWAHIDYRVDLHLIDYILSYNPDYTLYMVGPIHKRQKRQLEELDSKYHNLVLLPSSKLEDLPLEKFFCSIIPYKNNFKDIEAVTTSNKTFQLLSRGIPLVTHGMPYFLEHDAIYKSQNYLDFCNNLDLARNNYKKLQPAISSLVSQNQSIQRYNQITSIC